MAEMKRVIFKEALHNGTAFAGEFPMQRGPYIRSNMKRDAMFKIIKDNTVIRVHAFAHDYQIIGELAPGANVLQMPGTFPTPAIYDEMSEENLERLRIQIDRRFKVFNKLIRGVIAGNVRALIAAGAPGIGKTFDMENMLSRALLSGAVKKYTVHRGRISAIALFAKLFEHRDRGEVLVLDDTDVFGDETTLDLLKAALDTTKRRRLAWGTATTWLADNGIDNEFDFDGSCIFITNKDFDKILAAGGQLAVHVEALMSRATYMDLGIYTKLEIMVRIEQVVKNSDLLKDENLSEEQAHLLMDWLWDHFTQMRELSIRSVAKIGNFIKTDDEWQEMAEVTQLKMLRP